MMAKIRPLPPALQKKAIDELNEVPERVADDIQAIKDWINKQPHLRARTDDQFLVAFLRGCKFSLEKAKQKIDKFYTLKAALPEFVKNRDPLDPKNLELIRMGVSLRLRLPLHESGPRITIMRNGIFDPEKYTFFDFIKIAVMVAEIELLEDDNSTISGTIDIMDMSQVTMAHFFQLNPAQLRKISIFGEEALPIRPKGSHFIHTPPGFEPVFNAIKNILPSKTKSRIFVHGDNLDALYEHVPKKFLPIEYGGENGSIQDTIDYWEKKILSYRDYFLEDDKYGTDEHLRIGGKFNCDTLFGMEGSFRKLEVD